MRTDLAGLVLLVCLPTAHAQDDQTGSEPSAAAVAKKLADPNATLGQVSFPLDYVAYEGNRANSQSVRKLSFQPSLPYSLNESMNLFVRPLVPLSIDQPFPVVGD